MRIEQWDPADEKTTLACYEVNLAAHRADDPVEPPMSAGTFRVYLAEGFEHHPGEVWVAADDAGTVAGFYRLDLPDLENTDRAFLAPVVHPAARRARYRPGTAAARRRAGGRQRADDPGRRGRHRRGRRGVRAGDRREAVAGGGPPHPVPRQDRAGRRSPGCAPTRNGPRPGTRWCPGPGRSPSSTWRAPPRCSTRSTTRRAARGSRTRSGTPTGSGSAPGRCSGSA